MQLLGNRGRFPGTAERRLDDSRYTAYLHNSGIRAIFSENWCDPDITCSFVIHEVRIIFSFVHSVKSVYAFAFALSGRPFNSLYI